MEWIACDKKLPDDGTIVLTYQPQDPSEPVWFGYREADEWIALDGLPYSLAVTPWQHLPAPPDA